MKKRVVVFNDMFQGYFLGYLKSTHIEKNWAGRESKIYCVDVYKSIGVPRWQKKTDYVECHERDIAIFEK